MCRGCGLWFEVWGLLCVVWSMRFERYGVWGLGCGLCVVCGLRCKLYAVRGVVFGVCGLGIGAGVGRVGIVVWCVCVRVGELDCVWLGV